MSQGTSTLLYGVRAQVLGHYLSRFALVLAALTLVPFAVALMWRDTTLSLRLGVTALVLVALGWPGLRLPPPRRLQINEAAVIVALTFLVTPLLMAWSMAGAGLAPVDALFEAVSAVTTTGLTTLKSVEDMPPAFLFLRAWMQWYGGLGIAALSVALIMGHNAAARRLSQPQGSDDLATTARTHARQVLIAYVALTLLGFAILWAVLGHGYQALVHMLATVSTGGFSAYDTSLQEMPDLPAYVITVFSVLGALPFVLYYQLAAGRIRETCNDDELRALAFALALVIAVLSAALA